MRITTRFAAFALWTLCLAAVPSMADDSPSAHLVGYRCEAFRDGEAPPRSPASTVISCQIGDDPNPLSVVRSSRAESTGPTLDYLLNLVAILDNARDDASRTWHDAVVPTPTP